MPTGKYTASSSFGGDGVGVGDDTADFGGRRGAGLLNDGLGAGAGVFEDGGGLVNHGAGFVSACGAGFLHDGAAFGGAGFFAEGILSGSGAGIGGVSTASLGAGAGVGVADSGFGVPVTADNVKTFGLGPGKNKVCEVFLTPIVAP